MANEIFKLVATIETTGKTAIKDIKGVETQGSKTAKKLTKAFNGLAKVMKVAIVAGAAAATVAVVKMAKDGLEAFVEFEDGMNEVFTLLPDITQEAMDSMKEDVKSLAKEMGILPDEIVPALYQAISAGIPQENVFTFMEIASMAAIGGVTSLETAVDGLTSVVNAYGRETITATEASDIMFTAVRLGKCLTGNTRVLLANGRYERIDKLTEGATIVSFDGRSFVPMRAEWVEQGVKPTVELTTRLGRKITTTWNHPYLTKNGWKKVSELQAGDRIAVPTALPYFGEKKVPREHAEFLGLWLAEGTGGAKTPEITTTQYGEEVSQWAECFGCVARKKGTSATRAPTYTLSRGIGNRFGGKNPVMDYLRDLGIASCKAQEKHIPQEIFEWDRESIRILLRWLFNGDGWLCDLRPKRSGFQVGFVSKSEQLVRDVAHLVLRFGIVGRVRKRQNCWVWEANRYAEVERFVRLIGIDRPAAETVLAHAPVKQRAMWGVVEYDPIVSIEGKEDERVYDLVVDTLHNFVAEDIIAHNTTMDELADRLFQVNPIAAALGVSFGDVAAAMAEITAQGTPTRVAATQLRSLFQELSTDGSEVADVFSEIAGMSFQDFIAEGHDLGDALDLLADYAETNDIKMQDMFGSVEAGMGVLALTGKHADSFSEKIDEMADSAGATALAHERMAAGLKKQWDKIKAWWVTVKINIGERLQEPVQKFITFLKENQGKIEKFVTKIFDKLLDAFDWVMKNSGTIVKGIKAIGVALVVLVGVKVALWASNAVSAFTSLAAVVGISSPLALGIIAITALLGGLVYKLNEAEEDAATLAEGSVTAFEDMSTAAEWELETVGDALTANQQLQLETMNNVTRWMHENQEDRTQLTKEELEKRARMEVESAHELERMQKEAASSSIGTAEGTAQKMFDIGQGIAQTSQDVLAQVRAALKETGEEVKEVAKTFEEAYVEVEDTLTRWGISVKNVMTKMADYIGEALRSQITSRENYETRIDEISTERDAKEEEIVAAYDERIDEIMKMYENDEITFSEMQTLKAEALSDFLDAQTLANQIQEDQQTEAERRRQEERISFKEMLWQMASDFLSYIKEKLLIEAAWHAIEAVAWALVPPLFIANPGAIGHAAAALAMFAGAAGLAFAGFAEGGMVSGPTLGMVGEGAYSEAVLPLSPAVFSDIGAGIIAALPEQGGGVGGDLRGLSLDRIEVNVAIENAYMRDEEDAESISQLLAEKLAIEVRSIGLVTA